MGKDCRVSKNHMCETCGYTGHFEQCCRTRSDNQPSQQRGQRSRGRLRGRGSGRGRGRNVHNVEEKPDDDTDETGAYYIFTVGKKADHSNTDMHKFENTMSFRVHGQELKIIVDSGAYHNMMSMKDFKLLCEAQPIKLDKCMKKLYAYAAKEPLAVLGQCQLRISVPETEKSVLADFIVVPEAQVSLLSNQTSKELGVLSVGINVNACSPGQWDQLKMRYPRVFNGLGKLKDFQLKLHVDESVPPVIQTGRKIPFGRRKRVEEKLQELEKLDVIEKVKGPTHWISPMVPAKKTDGDIRLCLDMRRPNEAIIRERHPVPTVEETFQEMSGGKVFSKLDLNMACHQIELHHDSRPITTFAGPSGLYQYKRLVFGVNMATEKFQQLIRPSDQGLSRSIQHVR